MHVVNVELGDRSYPIYVGSGLLGDADLLRPHIAGNQVAVITNETVAPLYLAALQRALVGYAVDVHVIPDGERFKNLETYGGALDFLISHRHNRTTTLIALGGGVVGDLCGFVAATFQRGVRFIQIPTTLLAQVDSSVGGKTAVNHPRGKNLIGAFYQPQCVVADMATLTSLGTREFAAGLAEVLKYGVIADMEFFAWIEASAPALLAREPNALQHAVCRSCELKAQVVAADEREAGVRATLNFGHTFGHAIEALTDYQRYLHGEAVAIGMVQAADLSARLGWLAAADARRIKSALQQLGLPVQPPDVTPDAMLEAMGLDKKVVDGRLRLVLAQALGQVVVTDQFAAAALRDTLAAGERLCDG